MARAGKFRTPSLIERPGTETLDASGNVQDDWVAHARPYCDIREMTGREAMEAGRPEDRAVATMRVRDSAKMRLVDGSYRVTVRGRVWQVASAGAFIGPRADILEFKLEHGGAEE